MKHTLLIAIVVTVSLLGCARHSSTLVNPPASDLGHIDVVLDSVTWHAIKGNTFIRQEFGVLEVDTTKYGSKLSYDLYLLGSLNFLHLSLAKDFWVNQQGGGVVVFQTEKPGQNEALLNSWKPFYKDSLLTHTFKGKDFTLYEIMAWYQRDTTKAKEATMFANLTTYSVDAYKNWGITDSVINAGLAMKQFMGDWGGEPLKTRLFNSISELNMVINPQEFKEIKSALLAVGYKENGKNFSHKTNPAINITTSTSKAKSKFSSVKFKLNRPVNETTIVFSPTATLKLIGSEAWLIFN